MSTIAVVGCSSGSHSAVAPLPTAAERRAAPPAALGTTAVATVDPTADHSLHAAAAEAALHAVGDALGPFSDRPVLLGRAPDGRFLTRIEVHAISVSKWPRAARSTATQLRTARAFARRTISAIRRYRDVDVATTAGYVKVDDIHYVNAAAVSDGRVLDPEHPEALMYAAGPNRPTLVGAMYLAPGRGHGPQIGGPLTSWHYHLFGASVCMIGGGFPVALAGEHGGCVLGVPEVRSPEMLHVWIRNPKGTFDAGMEATN